MSRTYRVYSDESSDRCKDGKRWDKPNKEFKRMKNREFRAKCKDALVSGRELPILKLTAMWDWL